MAVQTDYGLNNQLIFLIGNNTKHGVGEQKDSMGKAKKQFINQNGTLQKILRELQLEEVARGRANDGKINF